MTIGMDMHEGQLRHSGEPYFTHPVAVAAILTEQQLDDATIITALLHDTIEDTSASYSEVAQLFGDEVAELVDGVTKLTNLQLQSTETKQAENFRKLFMAMSKDLRVILVKLADRLHNMRTIKAMRPEKQAQKARETMDIYAPLAGRMGMQWMREELEDLAFQVLNPEGRARIIRRFITLQRETGDVIQQITGDMRTNWTRPASRPRSLAAPRSPIRSGARCRKKSMAFRACPTSTAFASSPERGRLLSRAGRDPPALARGAGAVQGLHQPAQDPTDTARSTPLCRAAMASGSRCRSAPARCMTWPKPVSPRIGLTATVCGRKPVCGGSGQVDCQLTEQFDAEEITRISSRRSSWKCTPIRCSASPPRAM